jgi:curved DNA-binding protein CbpA
MNHYEILEVSPNASPEVLKAAYKSLMQRYHPDRNPGNAAAANRSVQVAQAYEVLSDAGKRAAYDIELKSRLESRNIIRDRTPERPRNILPSPPVKEEESQPSWVWLVMVAMGVLFIWFIWSPLDSKQSGITVPQEPQEEVLPGNHPPKSGKEPAPESGAALSARTISGFMRDIKIELKVAAEPKATSAADQKYDLYVLAIPTLDIVVGTFSPERFISFMDENREYIGLNLTEKLADVEYEMLDKRTGVGEYYLKQFILDSISEITGTDRYEISASSVPDKIAPYGAVDIFLPDSYTVTPKSGPVAAPPEQKVEAVPFSRN